MTGQTHQLRSVPRQKPHSPPGGATVCLLLILLMLFTLRGSAQSGEGRRDEYSTISGIPAQPSDSQAILQLIEFAFRISETRPDSALMLYQKGLQQSKEAGYAYGTVQALNYLSKLYSDKGMYNKSLFLLNEAMWYSNQTEQSRRESYNVYNNIGIIYNYQGKYPEAAQYYYKAARLAEKYDSNQVAQIYNNLAGVLFHLGLQTQPLYYLEKARRMAIRTRDRLTLTKVLLNMGTVYTDRKDWNKAMTYFNEVLDTARTYSIREAEYEALNALGELHLSRENPRQTLQYVKEAEALGIPVSSFRSNVTTLLSGAAWLQLEDYPKAEAYLKRGLEAAKTDRMADHIMEAHQFLARLYNATGRYTLAYEHLSECMRLKDSLQKKENARNINQLEVRFQSARKDKEIAENRLLISQQERNIGRKNMWMAVVIACISVVTILSVAVYRSNRIKQRMQAKQIEILEQKQEILSQKQEISQLKAMMLGEEKERARMARELHDGIGGMLSAVKMNLNAVRKQYPEFPGMKNLENVMHILQDTSAEVRKTAHNLMPDILVRHKLPEALQIYCDNINMANELFVALQMHGDLEHLDKSSDLLIYRTVQELLQNVIKHANATHAVIQIIRNGDELSLIAEDNGTGFNVGEQAEGYGLQNLRFRIQALEGSVSVESAKEIGTTIFIKLDIHKLNKIFAA